MALTTTQETYKSRRGRRPTGISWIVRNVDGQRVGRVERFGASRLWGDSGNYVGSEYVTQRFYQVQLDGFPHNPRRYPSLTSAVRHASEVYGQTH